MDKLPVLDVQQWVRNRAVATGHSAWLDEIPALVRSVEIDWSIVVGRALSGGTEAFVAEAAMSDGTPAVLKLLLPRGEDVAQHEIAALQLAAGEGCALLLRADADRGAMLLGAGSGLPTGAEKGR